MILEREIILRLIKANEAARAELASPDMALGTELLISVILDKHIGSLRTFLSMVPDVPDSSSD